MLLLLLLLLLVLSLLLLLLLLVVVHGDSTAAVASRAKLNLVILAASASPRAVPLQDNDTSGGDLELDGTRGSMDTTGAFELSLVAKGAMAVVVLAA